MDVSRLIVLFAPTAVERIPSQGSNGCHATTKNYLGVVLEATSYLTSGEGNALLTFCPTQPKPAESALSRRSPHTTPQSRQQKRCMLRDAQVTSQSLVYIFFGDNVLGVKREIWDPDTPEKQPLDCSQYEALARRATAAGKVPLT